MRNLGALVVLLALGLMTGVLERTPIGEFLASHHEHDGATEPHEHGDADDHHDGPDTPCHHHATHCCCAHTHAAPPAGSADLQGTFASERVQDAQQRPHPSHPLDSLPHVPRT